MDKTIRLVDEKKSIYQITVTNERFYALPDTDKTTGLPTFVFLPSATWIAGCWPKGIAFYKWLSEKGWDEAEAIKSAAGDKGSLVHQACEDIEKGVEIALNKQYAGPSGETRDLAPEEIECLASFIRWLDKEKPQCLLSEMTVVGDGYAGTIDRIYRIAGQIWIVDLKTSKSIWREHKLQVAAYSHANIDYLKLGITEAEWANRKLALLQVGYKMNKDGFKFTEVEDKYETFLIAKKIWQEENPEWKPRQIEYPLILKSQWVAAQAQGKLSQATEAKPNATPRPKK